MSNRLILILLISTLLGARSANPATPSRQGKDFALFFAVDSYDDPAWTDLNNPVRDAEAIAEELENHFGFEVEIHRNPSLNQIQNEIVRWQKKTLPDDAQLFIFFSGHGSVSEFDDEGYFMPKDADGKNKNHLSLSSLSKAVNRIPCKHTLLVIDACYSGTILERGNPSQTSRPRRLGETTEAQLSWMISRELTYPSRLILTSGGRERTSDGTNHSPLTEGILDTFGESLLRDGLIVWEQLIYDVHIRVKNPTPRYGTFEGHRNGGGFVFTRTDFIHVNPFDQIPLPNMIDIPGGTFTMGQPNPSIWQEGDAKDQQPPHELSISRFALSETEITNAQFCAFLNVKGNQEEGGRT